MPSGKIHDRVTLWVLPWITGASYFLTRDGELTLLVAGGFLFSGLMFGPDLDIYSIQYKRWGYLRWLWLPYQKALPHRSPLSHGFLIGTLLRVLYLGGICSLLALGGALLVHLFTGGLWSSAELLMAGAKTIKLYWPEAIALLLGLELGSLSHVSTDWLGSTLKRLSKRRSRPSKGPRLR